MEVYRDCKSYEEVLLPEEEVVWQGKPANLPILSKETKTALVLRWIGCAAAFVILTILYAVAAQNVGASFNILVVLAFVVVFGYSAVIPFTDHKSLQKKVFYYVTNKRVILMSGKDIYALNRAGINTKVVEGDCDSVHILFGSCVKKTGRQFRRYTVLPEVDGSDPSKNGFVFYGVSVGKDRLKNLLSV